MALSVNVAMTGYKALQLTGVSVSLIEALKKAKVAVTLTTKEFRFVGPDGVQLAHVEVNLDILQKLSAGVLSSINKIEIAGKLTKAAHQVIAFVGEPDDDTTTEPGAEADQPESAFHGTLAKLPKLVTEKPEKAAEPSSTFQGWGVMEAGKMKTYPQVPLREATQMYQPVLGTSTGSRYFVVAGGDGVMVAARYKGTTLSVRVEGQKFTAFKSALNNSGLKMNPDYASLHLEVGDDQLAQKTLGAVLLGLGVPLTTPIPNLMILKGA